MESISLQDFDINNCPSKCIVENKNFKIGLSKWVSPKRTRSYPYARVYDTLKIPKRIAVIPIIKDEGINGDRDFIQWDTISLLSLIDVYVILAYYDKAEKNPRKENKITSQKFNNHFIFKKLKEIQNFHSSLLHWNLNELRKEFPKIFKQAILSYKKISQDLNVQLHNFDSLHNKLELIENNIDNFLYNSRELSKQAQKREIITKQPKEKLESETKASITISNYLGGLYHLTTDEIKQSGNTIQLIESKHTRIQKLPSIDDIKDGLIKMILFTNLKSNEKLKFEPVLKLTSEKLIGEISSFASIQDLERFFHQNHLNKKATDLISSLIKESVSNNFNLIIEGLK